MSIEEKIRQREAELELCDKLNELWKDELFRWWFEERLEKAAESLCIESAVANRSYSDRLIISGAIRNIRSKRAEFKKYTKPGYRKELESKLEVLNERTGRRGDDSGGNWADALGIF